MNTKTRLLSYVAIQNDVTGPRCYLDLVPRKKHWTGLLFRPRQAGATSGFVSESLFGTLVGLLFLNPLPGFVTGSVVGIGAGALSGSLSDYGIDDDFIKSLAETIPADSSALFILVRKVQPEKVLAELSGVQGKVIRTSLSPAQEKKLQEALAGSTVYAIRPSRFAG